MTVSVCNKICNQCPWRRKSAPGFLGEASGDPWAFASDHIYGGLHLPCHMRVDWQDPNYTSKLLSVPTCRGFATFMANSGTPLPGIDVLPDHDTVFSNYKEFHEYHANIELARVFINSDAVPQICPTP